MNKDGFGTFRIPGPEGLNYDLGVNASLESPKMVSKEALERIKARKIRLKKLGDLALNR